MLIFVCKRGAIPLPDRLLFALAMTRRAITMPLNPAFSATLQVSCELCGV